MSIYRGTYYPATRCDGSARPGTRALMSWYLGAYGDRSAANLGTYVCKRLGSGYSLHAERRAGDLGTAPYGGVDSAWGWALANALWLNSRELGVQLIILGRKIWSCTYPDAGWRDYNGAYHGHLHVELTPHASRNLTTAQIQRQIGSNNTEGDALSGIIGLKHGDNGENDTLLGHRVKGLQSALNRMGHYEGKVDGWYGDLTAEGVLSARHSEGSQAESGNMVTGHAYGQILDAMATAKARAAVEQLSKEVSRKLEAMREAIEDIAGLKIPETIRLELSKIGPIDIPISVTDDEDE